MIQSPIAQITALCTLATTMAMAESGPRLVVTQLPADASSAPMLTQEGSEPLPLMLRLEFACGEQEELTALFVAAADTAVGATSARSPQDVLLKIPAGQLQAVRETAHCPAAGPLLLRAPLTTYASLSCRDRNGAIRTQTISLPLDIWFDCPQADDAERAGADSLLD